MKTRQEMKREYKERPKPAGIFLVRNTVNGKVLLGSSKNLEGPLNRNKFLLSIGRHPIEELQKDWNLQGADTFTFEIAEVVNVRNDPQFSLDDELTLLEMIWWEKLRPVGEGGYNLNEKIRQV